MTIVLLPVMLFRRLSAVGILNMFIMLCTISAMGIVVYFSWNIVENPHERELYGLPEKSSKDHNILLWDFASIP